MALASPSRKFGAKIFSFSPTLIAGFDENEADTKVCHLVLEPFLSNRSSVVRIDLASESAIRDGEHAFFDRHTTWLSLLPMSVMQCFPALSPKNPYCSRGAILSTPKLRNLSPMHLRRNLSSMLGYLASTTGLWSLH